MLRALDLVGFTFFGFFSCVLLIACWVIVHWPVFLGPEFLAVCVAVAMLVHVTLASRRVSAVDPVIWIPVTLLVFYFGVPFARFLGAGISYEAWSVQPSQNLARRFSADPGHISRGNDLHELRAQIFFTGDVRPARGVFDVTL
jgi:hypothetical protein